MSVKTIHKPKAMEPKCPNCKEQWYPDSEQFGCWNCGYRKGKEEDIWQALDRFLYSIQCEINSQEPDRQSVHFWLYKIERRIEMIRKAMEEREGQKIFSVMWFVAGCVVGYLLVRLAIL